MTWSEFLERYRVTEGELQAYVAGLPLWVNVWRGWMPLAIYLATRRARLSSTNRFDRIYSRWVTASLVTLGIGGLRQLQRGVLAHRRNSIAAGATMVDSTPRNRAASVYDAAADCFDVAALACWDRFGRRTVDRLSLPDGARVLDVCCGSGGSALPAAETVGPNGRVLGIDLAEKLLAQARIKAERANLANAEFRVGDLETLEGVSGSFDAVICVFGIFFVPDMAAAIARLWERVRPGGVLAVTTWGRRLFEPANTAFWEAVQRVAPALHKTFNPWERIAEPPDLRALFEEAGIFAVEVEREAATHALETPEDWWTIVLGSGYRGTVEQLDSDAREKVRAYTLTKLREGAVRSIEANVLYATARRVGERDEGIHP